MISRKEAHVLSNLLQIVMGAIEMQQPEKAKECIRQISEFIQSKTAPKPPAK